MILLPRLVLIKVDVQIVHRYTNVKFWKKTTNFIYGKQKKDIFL